MTRRAALLLALALALIGLAIGPAASRWVRAGEMLTRLANQNLADVDPEAWVVFLLHSHPPLNQRIEAAEKWAGMYPG